MMRFLSKALTDIRSNRFLNIITIMTIALSILLVSVFMLFFENASRVLSAWNQGGRAIVYLSESFTPAMLPNVKDQLMSIGGIEETTFIPKTQALEQLKKEMGARTQFLSTLQENPLPDAIEITIADHSNFEQIQKTADRIETLDIVDTVEYGQGWLGRFFKLFNLFKMTGYAMSGLFLMIALFITANTVRITFYARQAEVEIMRLVGATDGFIKTPFYVEGLLQGFFGGVLGIIILLSGYLTLSSGISQNMSAYVYLDIHFLSWPAMAIILFSSTFLGWFGCFISLKQILK
ncbi:permease-like cell division protein FtsX [uncultured Desulfobacter sp.]|uniref:permease-like cell division protein FtsX n=1 Tax=uncultured Desulfobacter sp. TaxID=240139 RepID=UPI0029F4CB0D|nr:permease-like cell division protein FtsX [uncultured Desulfobacter sp.]